MCSQPPRQKEDLNFHYQLNKLLVYLMPNGKLSLGITGGEPTLLGEKLNDLIDSIFHKNNDSSVHLLSNGRHFANKGYAASFARFAEKDFMIGIPLHSDYSKDHDEIAGAYGAYDQTLKGLYQLALHEVSVEIRIVINRLNYNRLPQLSRYIFQNFPFVRHIAFMGLEATGLAVKNKKQVWVSPADYVDQLEAAVTELADWKMNVSIYNIPLCQLKPTLYSFAKRSISDWKESYLDLCAECLLQSECCGIFSTAQYSDRAHIKPILD